MGRLVEEGKKIPPSQTPHHAAPPTHDRTSVVAMMSSDRNTSALGFRHELSQGWNEDEMKEKN